MLGLGSSYGGNVPDVPIPIQHGNVAELPPRLGCKGSRNEHRHSVLSLVMQSVLALVNMDGGLLFRVRGPVVPLPPQRALCDLDNAVTAAIVHFERNGFDALLPREILQQFASRPIEPIDGLIHIAYRDEPHPTVEDEPADDSVQGSSQVLILVHGNHGELGADDATNPVIFVNEPLPEIDYVVKVNQASLPELGLIGLSEGCLVLILTPSWATSNQMHTPVQIDLILARWLANASHLLCDFLEYLPSLRFRCYL